MFLLLLIFIVFITGDVDFTMNNSSISGQPFEKQVPFEALAVLLSLMSLGTITGNILVLLSIWTQPSLQRPTYIPIGSLALADLLAGAFAMPAYLIKKSPLELGSFEGVICDTFRFSYFISGYASIVSLTVISIERMVAVRFPLKYHSIISSRRLRLSLLVAWIDVLLVSSIPFIPLEGGRGGNCHYRPVGWWSLMVINCNVFAPFLFILICYVDIYSTVRRQIRKIRNENNISNLVRHRRETKGTMTVTIVLGLFIVSWFPSCLYYFLREICPQCFPSRFTNEGIFNSLVKLLTFAGSFWNPLIYCWRSLEFRAAFRKILMRKAIVNNALSPSFSFGVNMH